MSITDAFPMRKKRSVDKTPNRSTSRGKNVQCTPRRVTSNNSFLDHGLDIVWDNNSPSPSSTLNLGKRKKHAESGSSSSGGEISDLVKRLADKTGQTPEGSSLLNYWMQREAAQPDDEHKKAAGRDGRRKSVQTPARRPRRGLHRGKRTSVKQLTKELEMLASQMQPDATGFGMDMEPPKPSTSCSFPKVHRKPLTPLPNGTTTSMVPDKGKDTTGVVISPVLLPSDSDGCFWEEDPDDDILLSQIDISGMCETETQVFSHTQMLDSGGQKEASATNLKSAGKGEEMVALDDSIVTESWDFTDGLEDEDSILLSTLQEVEQSQTVNNIRHITNNASWNIHASKSQKLGQNNGKQTDKTGAKHYDTTIHPLQTSRFTKVSKYSKEDIERKRAEALQRRRLRLAK
ncbi:uncharacterized protein LOC116602309 isoform X2 [Nematostella vectensis]|uniref:uncharacterized protein LOC116602309 isoform X2 n=1 Tax=Nematostella vectensis TaxID=45351 RepID=UPI00207752E4|nr:uncharacterized protein LOC116602309 isoform X2 [Nematostella vectensis]